MYSRTTVRKLKFDWQSTELIVARIRGVPVVVVELGDLTKKTQVDGTAQCVVGDPDSLGDSGHRDFRIIVAALLLRNGDGLGPYQCGEGMSKSIFVRNRIGTKLGIENDTGPFGNGKCIGQFFCAGGRLGGGGGGLTVALARPAGGGRISEGNDGLFDNCRENIKLGEVKGGKLFCFFVDIWVVKPGFHGHSLLTGSDHEGPNGVTVKKRFGGVGEGGIFTGNVKGGVEVSLFADPCTLEGTGSIAKISRIITAVAGNSARSTIGTGNGGDEGPKRDRTNYMTRHSNSEK
jgi:hypothetical protein